MGIDAPGTLLYSRILTPTYIKVVGESEITPG
jgi:hypothetical protein